MDGLEELLPHDLAAGVGGQLQDVEAGGSGGQALVVAAVHSLDREGRLQRGEPQTRRALAGSDELQQRRLVLDGELGKHAPEA